MNPSAFVAIGWDPREGRPGPHVGRRQEDALLDLGGRHHLLHQPTNHQSPLRMADEVDLLSVGLREHPVEHTPLVLRRNSDVLAVGLVAAADPEDVEHLGAEEAFEALEARTALHIAVIHHRDLLLPAVLAQPVGQILLTEEQPLGQPNGVVRRILGRVVRLAGKRERHPQVRQGATPARRRLDDHLGGVERAGSGPPVESPVSTGPPLTGTRSSGRSEI